MAGLRTRRGRWHTPRTPRSHGPHEEADGHRQHRFWIFPRDPLFAARAIPILDLYAGVWQGERLHPGDYVICADEKPSIQARHRKAPTRPHQPG
ncbi:MAG TPA: hypothetical protein VF526_10085 [Solirubrobacteraceae bacterium]